MASRDDTPNLAEVSPLDVCSASTIPPKGMDGHNNLVQTLLSHYNSLDVSQTVGLQAYDELKGCLQDGFQLVDCILPCISNFVHLTNNQTATEASTKYKRALKGTVVKPAKIVMKATVRNVIKQLDNFQGAYHAPGYPSGMGCSTLSVQSTFTSKSANPLVQPTEPQPNMDTISELPCTPTSSGGPGWKATKN